MRCGLAHSGGPRLGLNLVVLTLRVQPPWAANPWARPLTYLHRKHDLTTLDLAEQMVWELATWFPERCWRLAADGLMLPWPSGDCPAAN